MIRQAISQLLQTEDINPSQILLLQLASPIYYGRTLQNLVEQFYDLHHPGDKMQWVFFDDIQYKRDWQAQLSSLIQNHPNIRFVASGSATGTLQKFCSDSDPCQLIPFILPPLTFFEYLRFTGQENDLIIESSVQNESKPSYQTRDIKRLNEEFVNYLNFGGFPESALNSTLCTNEAQVFSDELICKVILNDQASLYGISDTQELNQFLCKLALQTGQEFGIEELSKLTGIAKSRINYYLEYLETAHLIKRVNRINENAVRMSRERTFKIHLINSSLRTMLLGRVTAHDDAMPRLAETAIWAQWMHSRTTSCLHNARWREGRQEMEVELVALDEASQKPLLAANISWSDQPQESKNHFRSLLDFTNKHQLRRLPLITTRGHNGITNMEGIDVQFIPTALYCYTISRNLIQPK
jgi:predicted AAA+ superfamily ATPase